MGLDLLLVFDDPEIRRHPLEFGDATTRTLLYHLTVLEYLDELALEHSFTSPTWYVKPWHGRKRLGKAPRKRRGGWFDVADGLQSFDALLKLLAEQPGTWRACLERKEPKSSYGSDEELEWLRADVRAFRECLATAAESGAGFHLAMM